MAYDAPMALPPITPQLGEAFLGGLLAVARADGHVTAEELRELRTCADRLEIAVGAEDLLLEAAEVTATLLARALGGEGDAYRAADSTEALAVAFLDAALRMALADHELCAEEVALLREFERALGVPTAGISGWHVLSAYE